MTSIKKFEDIVAYQKAGLLALSVYKIFSKNRDWGFKDQVCRAAVSVMNNIAEGFERRTNKEFINFLYIAKGSAGELRSMTYLAYKLDYVTESEANKMMNEALEISRLIMGLIKTLR